MAPRKNPKKVNLMHHNTIKHALDESVTEIVTDKGYREDFRVSNVRLLIGIGIVVVALFAQFYNRKFPENRDFVIGCIALYAMLNGILQLIILLKEKNVVMFTYPPPGSFYSTRLVITSKLPKFSDVYTLTVASADPQSVSTRAPVELMRSVTKWFTRDGFLVEGLLWKDVEWLIDEYAKESVKTK